MKKGISLITLIITIVVIIILSAAVILSLNNGGVIDSARIASLASDQSNLQTSIELYLTNVVSSNLDMDFDKEKILLGDFDDLYRIVEKNGENLVEAIIEKNGEEIQIYKLDEELCKNKGIEFPKTPSNSCDWYISKNGQVYLVYEENAIISSWIIGNPPEGKQIESDVLDKFVAKIGEWEKQPEPEPEPNIYDIIQVADANMFKYTNATNGTVSITGFNPDYADTIPSEIKFPTIDPKGNTVVGITNGAFRGNTNLNKIVVTEGITTIEDNAFDSCENLEEVYLPTTLTYMRYATNSPFSQCTKIEKITIPSYVVSGLYTNPSGIFGDSKTTIKNVEFVGDITSISASAFSGFTALEKITIPNNVTSIGNSAFQNCTSLSGKIIIPENVESVGHYAFSGCKSIAAVEFLSKGKLLSIGNQAFSGLSLITSLKIPEGVTTIEDNAFGSCQNLEEVYLPTTLSYMRYATNSPFSQCIKIEKITIPNFLASGVNNSYPSVIFTGSKATIKNVEFVGDITSISASAFSGFTALEKITIPNTVTSIGNSAFQNCTSLSGKIIIPENVESVGRYAFSGCKSITALEFLSKGKLLSIGNQAFSGLSLITSLKVPEGVTTIEDNAFGSCENLEEVYLPTTLTYMRYATNSPFSQCIKIEKITIPNYVVSGLYTNPSGIFGDSKTTIKNVEFVGDITSISASAFSGFTALEKITIPNTVTSIGNSAFQNCTSLSGKIIIPENVESVGRYAFSGCKSITALEFLSKGKLLSIGNQAFSGLSLITSLKVPEGVTTIEDNAFGNCENLKEVYLPTTLSYMRYNNNSPFSNCLKIEKITIPNFLASGVNNSYPSVIFTGSKATVKNVEFVGDITTISANAFNSFTALETITIPDTVTSIASNAFYSCTNLKTINYSGTATGSPWGATNATVVAQ